MRWWVILLWIGSLLLAGFGGWWFAKNEQEVALKAPIVERIRKFDKYSYENLSKRAFEPVSISIEETIKEFPDYTSYKFSYITDGKKVTGQLNVPSTPEPEKGFPTIFMIRGYAEQEGYVTGSGTRNAAGYFAARGFLTIAPDFLGYGGSDPINTDVLEARFETYTTALTLLNSLENVKQADTSNLFLWGHSNGGHLSTALLEITGREIPATLWAPVTKPFPYSVLVYTDDSDDQGKFLRKTFAEFERDYDVYKYSVDKYVDRINAPIQLHQGTADLLVLKRWSDEFVKTLKSKEKDVTYYVYPGADHNLSPSWNIVVERDLAFFRKHMK